MALSDLFGSTTPTNDQIVDAQRAAALEAERLAENQKLRRQGAQAQIDAIFGGGVYDPNQYLPFDWEAIDANREGWENAQSAAASAAADADAAIATAAGVPPGTHGGVINTPVMPAIQYTSSGAAMLPDWLDGETWLEARQDPNWTWQDAWNLHLKKTGKDEFQPPEMPAMQYTSSGAAMLPDWLDGETWLEVRQNPNWTWEDAWDLFLKKTRAGAERPGAEELGFVDPENYRPRVGEGSKKTYTGIGDDFYNAYRNSIINYYEPQLEDALRDAEGQTTLGFSSRGTRNSSAAENAFADLNKDHNLQYGAMVSNADNQTGQLKRSIRGEKDRLLALAASAEDPTRAVNSALSEVNAVQTQKPDLTPLGDIFNSAAIGYWAYEDEKNRQQFFRPSSGGTSKSTGRTIGG